MVQYWFKIQPDKKYGYPVHPCYKSVEKLVWGYRISGLGIGYRISVRPWSGWIEYLAKYQYGFRICGPTGYWFEIRYKSNDKLIWGLTTWSAPWRSGWRRSWPLSSPRSLPKNIFVVSHYNSVVETRLLPCFYPAKVVLDLKSIKGCVKKAWFC